VNQNLENFQSGSEVKTNFFASALNESLMLSGLPTVTVDTSSVAFTTPEVQTREDVLPDEENADQGNGNNSNINVGTPGSPSGLQGQQGGGEPEAASLDSLVLVGAGIAGVFLLILFFFVFRFMLCGTDGACNKTAAAETPLDGFRYLERANSSSNIYFHGSASFPEDEDNMLSGVSQTTWEQPKMMRNDFSEDYNLNEEEIGPTTKKKTKYKRKGKKGKNSANSSAVFSDTM